MRVPAGKPMTRSTTVSMLCFSMTRPHLGQWGVPQRA